MAPSKPGKRGVTPAHKNRAQEDKALLLQQLTRQAEINTKILERERAQLHAMETQEMLSHAPDGQQQHQQQHQNQQQDQQQYQHEQHQQHQHQHHQQHQDQYQQQQYQQENYQQQGMHNNARAPIGPSDVNLPPVRVQPRNQRVHNNMGQPARMFSPHQVPGLGGGEPFSPFHGHDGPPRSPGLQGLNNTFPDSPGFFPGMVFGVPMGGGAPSPPAKHNARPSAAANAKQPPAVPRGGNNRAQGGAPVAAGRRRMGAAPIAPVPQRGQRGQQPPAQRGEQQRPGRQRGQGGAGSPGAGQGSPRPLPGNMQPQQHEDCDFQQQEGHGGQHGDTSDLYGNMQEPPPQRQWEQGTQNGWDRPQYRPGPLEGHWGDQHPMDNMAGQRSQTQLSVEVYEPSWQAPQQGHPQGAQHSYNPHGQPLHGAMHGNFMAPNGGRGGGPPQGGPYHMGYPPPFHMMSPQGQSPRQGRGGGGPQHQRGPDVGQGKGFRGAMAELRAGPSDEQRRHMESQRTQLQNDLQAQIQEKKDRVAQEKAVEKAQQAKEEAEFQAYHQRMAAAKEEEKQAVKEDALAEEQHNRAAAAAAAASNAAAAAAASQFQGQGGRPRRQGKKLVDADWLGPPSAYMGAPTSAHSPGGAAQGRESHGGGPPVARGNVRNSTESLGQGGGAGLQGKHSQGPNGWPRRQANVHEGADWQGTAAAYPGDPTSGAHHLPTLNEGIDVLASVGAQFGRRAGGNTSTSGAALSARGMEGVAGMLSQLQQEQAKMCEEFSRAAAVMEQFAHDASAVAADRQRAWADVERVRGDLARHPAVLQGPLESLAESSLSLDGTRGAGQFVVSTHLLPRDANTIPTRLCTPIEAPWAAQREPLLRHEASEPTFAWGAGDGGRGRCQGRDSFDDVGSPDHMRRAGNQGGWQDQRISHSAGTAGAGAGAQQHVQSGIPRQSLAPTQQRVPASRYNSFFNLEEGLGANLGFPPGPVSPHQHPQPKSVQTPAIVAFGRRAAGPSTRPPPSPAILRGDHLRSPKPRDPPPAAPGGLRARARAAAAGQDVTDVGPRQMASRKAPVAGRRAGGGAGVGVGAKAAVMGAIPDWPAPAVVTRIEGDALVSRPAVSRGDVRVDVVALVSHPAGSRVGAVGEGSLAVGRAAVSRESVRKV